MLSVDFWFWDPTPYCVPNTKKNGSRTTCKSIAILLDSENNSYTSNLQPYFVNVTLTPELKLHSSPELRTTLLLRESLESIMLIKNRH